MDEARALSLLGLAMRAGQVITGDDSAERAARQGRAALVLLDEGASANTRKKYEALCGTRGIPLALTAPDAMGRAVGKPGRMVAAVRRGPFSEKLTELFGKP